MRQVAVLTTFLFFFTAGASADPGGHHERHTDRAADKLQLSDEQAPTFKQIMQEQHEKRHAIFESDTDQAQKRTQLEALRAETRQRLAGILNAEQLQRMERFRSEQGDARRPGDTGRFAEELQLTEEQARTVNQIMREQHEKRRAIFESDKERVQKHAELEALHAETKERLASVLNTDQMARFEEHHRRGRSGRTEGDAASSNGKPAPAQ